MGKWTDSVHKWPDRPDGFKRVTISSHYEPSKGEIIKNYLLVLGFLTLIFSPVSIPLFVAIFIPIEWMQTVFVVNVIFFVLLIIWRIMSPWHGGANWTAIYSIILGLLSTSSILVVWVIRSLI